MTTFFTIPDKETNYQAYMVYVLTVIWSMVTGITVSFGFGFFPQIWQRWLLFLCISIVIAVVNIAINRYGYVRLASWSLSIMLWLYITIPCYSAGGIMAPGILSQMSVILTAGFLLGGRGGLVIGLLTMGTDLGLAWLEMTGHLPSPQVVHNPLTRWIGAIIPFGTILALQYYATNHLRSGLSAMQREVLKREEAEKIKDHTLYNLGERVKELKTLYAVSRILLSEDDLPEKLYFEIAEAIPLGWQYPDITAACVSVSGKQYATANYRPSDHRLLAEMKTSNGTDVSIEVVYLETKPEMDEGPFLKEERSLIDSLVEMLKIDTERKAAEGEIIQSEQRIRKITSQVPGNTYVFEIEETGKTFSRFFYRGADEINDSINTNESKNATETLKESIFEDDKPRWIAAMTEAYKSGTFISVQYRMWVNDQLKWRWFRAIPERNKDGKVLWYGASQDITPLVKYIVSVEQILFDISHVIRRPISTMKGMTALIGMDDITEAEMRDMAKKLEDITDEIDDFLAGLNQVYDNQRHENTLSNFDFSQLIDKRKSLFN